MFAWSKGGSRGHKRRIVLWAVAALVIAWLAGFVWFSASLPRAEPVITDRTGGIVVLTGGDQRLTAAMDLLDKGYGQRLLVTGVNRATARTKLKTYMGKGAPSLFDCCVDLGREAQDTIGNAQETASWVVSHGYASVIVVTASYHMPRALVELRHAVPGCMLVPYPVFTDTVRLSDWWRWSGTTRLLAFEYTKYLASVARVVLLRLILTISGS
jgi:uncharacterized SAM-binding protein YcdF (DUF218 family)